MYLAYVGGVFFTLVRGAGRGVGLYLDVPLMDFYKDSINRIIVMWGAGVVYWV